MYTVALNNSGGELDHRKVTTPEAAAKAAAEMIKAAGVLYNGDSITIVGEEGDE